MYLVRLLNIFFTAIFLVNKRRMHVLASVGRNIYGKYDMNGGQYTGFMPKRYLLPQGN